MLFRLQIIKQVFHYSRYVMERSNDSTDFDRIQIDIYIIKVIDYSNK